MAQSVSATLTTLERQALARRWRPVALAALLHAIQQRLHLHSASEGQLRGLLYERESGEQSFDASAPEIAGQAPQSSPLPPGQELRAFEAFFHQHERQVVAFLWRMTGDEQTAHDLSQEVFVRAWRHFARISEYEQPGAWLLRVATNLALTHLRGSGARATDALSEDDEPARSDPARRFVERDLVERTLLELTPQQRASLVLREVYGFSCEEIGQTLGVSRGAIKMALLRGREQFRARYLRYTLDDSSGRFQQGYGQGYGQRQEGGR